MIAIFHSDTLKGVKTLQSDMIQTLHEYRSAIFMTNPFTKFKVHNIFS